MKQIVLLLLFVTVHNLLYAAPPDWSVNSSNYTNSMSVTCVLVINGEESADGSDMIAAFVNGECRGVKNPVYIEAIDRWVAFLVIFSNESSDAVSFKIYDASADKVLDALATLDFETDAHLGLATAPYVWSDSPILEETEIVSFTIEGQTAETHITENKVTVIMPAGTELTALVPEFALSDYANARVNNSVQLSGVSERDFTNPVEYDIYAANDADSSKKD